MKTKNKFTLNEVLNTLKEKKLKRDEYSLLYSGFETQVGKEGYLQFRVNEKDKWKNVHTLVNQYFNSEEHDKKYKDLVETKIEKCLVTHHTNFFEKENKLNNHPDNLLWLGRDEHRILHQEIIREVTDKIWNPENPEYYNFEKQRVNIRLLASIAMKKKLEENWHGENSEEYREKIKQFLIKRNIDLWYGENGEKYRDAHVKQLEKLWYGENSEEFREKMKSITSKNMFEVNEKLWHGENSEEYREKMKPIQSENGKQAMVEFWHGENSEDRRIKILKNAKKQCDIINKNPKIKKKMIEGKVFKIFDKIIKNNKEITNDTFCDYRNKNTPFPKTVFGSIKNAIKKYEIHLIKKQA